MSLRYFWGIGMVGILLGVSPSLAAERIIVRVAPLEQSLSVRELRTFADTREPSPTLQAIFAQAKLDPAQIHRALTAEWNMQDFGLTLPLVSRLLNTYLAELLLQDLGRALRPPGVERATVQALRAGMVNSLSDDGKISVIEFLEKYPTDLLVDAGLIQETLGRILKDIGDLQQPLQQILRQVRS